MKNFFQSSLEGLIEAANSLLRNMPDLCPFAHVFEEIERGPFSEYLGYINYFLPVTEVVAIGLAWMLAVFGYYAISFGLRWANLIS